MEGLKDRALPLFGNELHTHERAAWTFRIRESSKCVQRRITPCSEHEAFEASFFFQEIWATTLLKRKQVTNKGWNTCSQKRVFKMSFCANASVQRCFGDSTGTQLPVDCLTMIHSPWQKTEFASQTWRISFRGKIVLGMYDDRTFCTFELFHVSTPWSERVSNKAEDNKKLTSVLLIIYTQWGLGRRTVKRSEMPFKCSGRNSDLRVAIETLIPADINPAARRHLSFSPAADCPFILLPVDAWHNFQLSCCKHNLYLWSPPSWPILQHCHVTTLQCGKRSGLQQKFCYSFVASFKILLILKKIVSLDKNTQTASLVSHEIRELAWDEWLGGSFVLEAKIWNVSLSWNISPEVRKSWSPLSSQEFWVFCEQYKRVFPLRQSCFIQPTNSLEEWTASFQWGYGQNWRWKKSFQVFQFARGVTTAVHVWINVDPLQLYKCVGFWF